MLKKITFLSLICVFFVKWSIHPSKIPRMYGGKRVHSEA